MCSAHSSGGSGDLSASLEVWVVIFFCSTFLKRYELQNRNWKVGRKAYDVLWERGIMMKAIGGMKRAVKRYLKYR